MAKLKIVANVVAALVLVAIVLCISPSSHARAAFEVGGEGHSAYAIASMEIDCGMRLRERLVAHRVAPGAVAAHECGLALVRRPWVHMCWVRGAAIAHVTLDRGTPDGETAFKNLCDGPVSDAVVIKGTDVVGGMHLVSAVGSEARCVRNLACQMRDAF